VSVSVCFIMTKAAIIYIEASLSTLLINIRLHVPLEEATESCHMFIAFRLVKNENVWGRNISWRQ
jgi:hypothetical protein